LKIVFLLMAMMISADSHAQKITITNGVLWTDNNGKTVQAHGGNFLKKGKWWYLIGEDRNNEFRPDVNMYKSKDFVNWKFVGKIIGNGISHPELGKTRMIERPKLLKCEKTGKYVIWCHWESSNYSASEVGVFISDKIEGPYKYAWSGRPLGIKSRDCNVFTDNDGKAYFISTTNENQDLGLFELSDDYTKPVSHTKLLEGQRREAPAIVKVDNLYYMVSSACTGWAPNQAKLTTSTSLKDFWSPLSDVGDEVAFDTQASSILTVKGKEGTVYIYVGDRWMDPKLPDSKIIMLPVTFENGKMTFEYRDKWILDMDKGKWYECE